MMKLHHSHTGILLVGVVVVTLHLACCFVQQHGYTSSRKLFFPSIDRQTSRRKIPLQHPFALLAEGDIGGKKSDHEYDNGTIISMEDYWNAYSDEWEKMFRVMDVRAAYEAGSLNGIMPSGRLSRAAPNERMISLPRALELFEQDEESFLVRRRYRKMRINEFEPRWEKVIERKKELQKEGKWNNAVIESEKYREFEKSLVEGTVESEDASPAYSRFVVTLLSPALRAAANQRNRADGGMMQTRTNLLETAGSTPSERWITSALLSDFDEELGRIMKDSATSTQTQTFSFNTQEAEQDIEDAGSGALYGVLLAIITFGLYTSLQQL